MENNSGHINQDWLSKLPKNSGHEAPEGYFDSIENSFSMKLAEQSIPTKDGFKTPEGYFDTLESRIIENFEFPKKGKVISLRKRMIKFLPTAAAASVLLFLSINIFLTENILPTEPSSDEIAIWFEENISTITNDDLTSLLSDEDFEDSPFLDDAIDTEDISKYLDENDTYILIEDSDISINELK